MLVLEIQVILLSLTWKFCVVLFRQVNLPRQTTTSFDLVVKRFHGGKFLLLLSP